MRFDICPGPTLPRCQVKMGPGIARSSPGFASGGTGDFPGKGPTLPKCQVKMSPGIDEAGHAGKGGSDSSASLSQRKHPNVAIGIPRMAVRAPTPVVTYIAPLGAVLSHTMCQLNGFVQSTPP